MNWLAGTTALTAAAIAVPLLVAMYFLKLKRREELIPSTLLWKRAVQDLQVNAPFQRLRRNLLLLLQLLVLIAALIALGRPVMSLSTGPGRKLVLLIDRSASMNAVEDGRTRLDEARELARLAVHSMRRGGISLLRDRADQAMVVAFAGSAKVMCNFTSDRRQLLSAIDAIEPTDGASSLSEATAVAQAFSQAAGEEADTRGDQGVPELLLFSDGRISDLDALSLGSSELTFHRVGTGQANVAITTMQARRSYEDPAKVEVFAELANFGAERVTCDVQLSVNGDLLTVRSVSLGTCTRREGDAVEPGRASVSFGFTRAQGGVIEVRHLADDELACDNAAWSILQPPRRLRVLLVTKGNPTVEAALRACPLEQLELASPDEFAAMDLALLEAEQPYDAIVLDRVAPEALPRGRYVCLGASPPGAGATLGEELKTPVIVDWRARHPATQYVRFENLYVARSQRLDAPRDAEVLAEFADAPALVVTRRKGSTFVLVAFDPLQSNWPFEPGFVMFFYNATRFLGLEEASGRRDALRVGEPILIDGLPASVLAKVASPSGVETELSSDAGGTLRYPGTLRAGLYGVEVEGRRPGSFAVNLFDPAESDILPAEDLVLSGRQISAELGAPREANVELWPIAAAFALALVCLEWVVYNARIRI
jgi:VWA domain-containing protein/aerotolerance regulator-like protein